MRILILGAGRVGESVAESLVSEHNDITVIDPDPETTARFLEEKFDLRGVAGQWYSTVGHAPRRGTRR
jgi:trk system potassium uptake protein TrkA